MLFATLSSIWWLSLGALGIVVGDHVRVDMEPIGIHWSDEAADDGPRILVIGDSHLNGTFGKRLSQFLRELPGAKVRLIGSCGRWSNAWVRGLRAHCGLRMIDEDGAVSWGKGCARNPCSPRDGRSCSARACRTPKIETLLEEFKPDMTVVSLGGNSIFRSTVRNQWQNIEPYVVDLARSIHESGSDCMWVTPAHGLNKSRSKMRHFRDFLGRVTTGYCGIFDSGPRARPYLDYKAAVSEAHAGPDDHDKIHYDRLGRAGRWRVEQWARDVMLDVVERLERGKRQLAVDLAFTSWLL